MLTLYNKENVLTRLLTFHSMSIFITGYIQILLSTDLISQLWYKPTYHDHPSEQNKMNNQNFEAIKNSCKTERYPYYY